jgi:IclR family mhp operon transcriptional activator
MDERQEVKSLKKALRALTFLNTHGESTVTEVACAIGVPRTTAYRLLETLAAEGYMEKQPHSVVYRLTSMVQRLSAGFGDTDLVVEVAKPLIHHTGEEIGWPIAFATPRGKDMVVRVITDHDTTLAIDRYMIGFTTPILHAPSGFCYLAYCDEDTREQVVEMTREAHPGMDSLRFDNDYLEYMFAQVRARGFCHILFSEYSEGGLAVPVVIGGRPIGGLVMRYIKSAMRSHEVESRYAPRLRELAARIAAEYEMRASQRLLDGDRTVVPFTPALAMTAPVDHRIAM